MVKGQLAVLQPQYDVNYCCSSGSQTVGKGIL
jgi:hypothetical protein